MTHYDFFNALNRSIRTLKPGSLTFWGDWFGRPYDNFHRIAGVNIRGEELQIIVFLNHGENIVITEPSEWSLDDDILLVGNASSVRFNWFYYGRVPSAESLRFMEYNRLGDSIKYVSNSELHVPTLDASQPAVQMHTSP